MMIPVVGFGCGGHAGVLAEILRLDGRYELVGLLDSNLQLKGQVVHGARVLGDDSVLPGLMKDGVRHFFVGVGSVSQPLARRRIYESACSLGLQPVDLVHPRAILSPLVEHGPGLMVMAGAILNPGVRLGENVIVNTGAILDHDCRIGSHVHAATGARLSGGVTVEDEVHIGAGAVVRQSIHIGRGAVVGAGAVVVKDVPPGVTVVGNPARLFTAPAF